MSFIDSITERENQLLINLEKCKTNGYATYIFGDGQGADFVEKKFYNFNFSGRVVNKKYYKQKDNVFCLEDLLEKTKHKINLLVAFCGFYEEQISQYKDKIGVVANAETLCFNHLIDPNFTSFEYILENSEKLQKTYDMLEDEKSKKCLSAFINQKISLKSGYLKDIAIYPQYFSDEVMPLSNNEVFVDCGAYDGDTALAFISELESRGINNYKKIISIEPDPMNFEKLKNRGLSNHQCLNIATSDKKDQLSFCMSNTSSYVCNDGEIIVNADKLDDVLDDDVTLIKMDIEGAELASLKGCKKTIVKNRPKLAICIYHKKEDLWEIPQYISSIIKDYKFYIRHHSNYPIELVFYAIPNELS